VRELFIYYRATVEDADALQAAALAMQADLQARHAGLQTRLLRRPEPADGLHTWMEIYALPLTPVGLGRGTPDDRFDALRRDIESAAHALLGHGVHSARHIEVFEPCAS